MAIRGVPFAARDADGPPGDDDVIDRAVQAVRAGQQTISGDEGPRAVADLTDGPGEVGLDPGRHRNGESAQQQTRELTRQRDALRCLTAPARS